MTLDEALGDGAPPLMAILRGVRPDEVVAIGTALVEAGIRLIEVPFNSPRPEDSITRLVEALGARAAIGGGTILSATMAAALAQVGGRFMVSPNTDAGVIAASIAHGLEAVPGFFTPTEAFVALAAGARKLKLFPGATVSPAYLAAIRALLPADAEVWIVGGANPETFADWCAAGAAGFGIGTALYRSGDRAEQVGVRARELVAAWNGATAGRSVA